MTVLETRTVLIPLQVTHEQVADLTRILGPSTDQRNQGG